MTILTIIWAGFLCAALIIWTENTWLELLGFLGTIVILIAALAAVFLAPLFDDGYRPD